MTTEDTDIDDIEERAEEYNRYDRMSKITGGLYSLWFVLISLAYVTLRPLIFPTPVSTYEAFIPVSVGGILPLLVIRFANKRRRKYLLEDNEWIVYYANSIFESLEDCIGNKNNEMKKDFRKEALRKARGFLSYVKETWSYGSFKLATDYFGDSIKEFKRNLRFRLIPSIEDGDDETLRKAGQVMYYLLSGYPNFDTIKALNKQMSEGLPNREPLKMGIRNRLSNFLVVHKTMRDGLAVVLSSAAAIIFYSLAIYFQWASIDYVFGGGVAIFGVLLTIYFTRLRKTD